jgi:hypothetical protein
MSEEKYDVAFSFVDEADLQVAKDLASMLEPELSTFVYVNRQDAVGGSDGMSTFATVFKRDTRLAVILLRPRWGHTPFTAVEEAAIKERALATGFRSFMVVAMEPGITPPAWIPSFMIYQHGWQESRSDTAAVIRARARDVGAVLKVETLADVAAKRAAQRRRQEERAEFMRSPAGAAAAWQEAERLLAEVERHAAALTDAVPLLQLRSDLKSASPTRVGCVITGPGRQLALWWEQPDAEQLRGSRLEVGDIGGPGGATWAFYDFALTDDGEPAWRFRELANARSSAFELVHILSGAPEAVRTVAFAEQRLKVLVDAILPSME